MKTSLFTLLVSFTSLLLAMSRAEPPPLPGEVDGYYQDFNHLTLRELQPAKGGSLSTQAFTLEVPPPESRAVETLRQRLLDRRLQIDPEFNQGVTMRTRHEPVLLRVTTARRAGALLTVQCEIYEPVSALPEIASDLQAAAAVAALDFTRMKRLRRETHQWRQIGGEWMLYGTVQDLAQNVGRSQ